MTQKDKDKIEKARKEHNDHILLRMKNPQDKLSAFDSSFSSFPDRPQVKKDKKAMRKLYKGDIGDGKEKDNSTKK